MSTLRVLVQIAFRNLFSSWINLIIGLLILAGTALLVIGGSMVGTLGDSMSQSVTGSVAGDIQIYNETSKDPVQLYGDFGGEATLSPMTNFPDVKSALEQLPNVEAVVPMGLNGAMMGSGNIIDITLASLRDLYKQKASGQNVDEAIQAKKELVRQNIRVLEQDLERSKKIASESALLPEELEAMAIVSKDAFWSDFDKDPYQALEFLENRIAPMIADGDLVYLRYLGTDLEQFQRSFDRMKIVDGQKVPAGRRGILFAKFFYEEFMKLKNARRLDKLKEGVTEGKKTIATDPQLQNLVKENQLQTREIELQLDALETKALVGKLQKKLDNPSTDLTELLRVFFTTDDSNILDRHAYFYAEIAPMLELYRVRIGDTMTLKSFTRSGYVTAVNVPVFGTFDFKGLEKSPLAGQLSLLDLMSFRDLYGYVTPEKLAELKALREKAGVKDVSRDTAEAELFGSDATVVEDTQSAAIEEKEIFSGEALKAKNDALLDRVYSQEEIESGFVLNAAVLLKDPDRLGASLQEIERVSKEKNLGLKAMSWQDASGFLGQMVMTARIVIYSLVFIIFLIVMVIMINAMVMATMQRTQTIGTMRAIGAQRPFVLMTVVFESVVLGILFGVAGMLLGAGVMALLGSTGIPATNDELYFFFSGPILYPQFNSMNLLAALAIILVVSTLATLYPAVMATRISPLKAMQTEE